MNMPQINPEMMVNMIIRQNPQLSQVWNQAKQMTNGKGEKELESIIKNTAQTQGIDLVEAWSSFAQMFGLNTNTKPF